MTPEQLLTDLYAAKAYEVPLAAQLRLAKLYAQGKSLAEMAQALKLDKLDTVSRRLAWLKKHGIITQRRKRKAPLADGQQLTARQVVAAVKARLAGEMFKDIARPLGVSASLIQAICAGKAWVEVVAPYAAQLAAMRTDKAELLAQVQAGRDAPPEPTAPLRAAEQHVLGAVKVFDGRQLGDYGRVVPDNAAYLTLKVESSNLNLSTTLVQEAGWQAGDRIRFLEDAGTWYLGPAGLATGFLLSHLTTRTLTTNVGPVADMLRDRFGLLITKSYRLRVELDAASHEGLPVHRLTDEVQQTTGRPKMGSLTPKPKK